MEIHSLLHQENSICLFSVQRTRDDITPKLVPAAESGVTITELEYCCLGVIYEVLAWWCQLSQTMPGHATCNIPSVGVTMYIYIIELKEWGEIL